MICPKCGYSKASGEECGQCGIIFAKYQAIQERRAERARKKNDSADEPDLLAHYYDSQEVPAAPKTYLGSLAAQYFWAPYNSPWKPVTKGKMIALSLFFVIFIYLLFVRNDKHAKLSIYYFNFLA